MKKVEGTNLVVVRRLDKNGRIGIPMEVRRYLGLEVDDGVEFYIDREGVYIRPYNKEIKIGELRKSRMSGKKGKL